MECTEIIWLRHFESSTQRREAGQDDDHEDYQLERSKNVTDPYPKFWRERVNQANHYQQNTQASS